MSKVGKKKPLKVLFTAYYKITHFFPIQDPHIRYGEMSQSYKVTKVNRFIELGLSDARKYKIISD